MAFIYLDYNATTPVAPEVLEAMLPYFGARFGNASSAHHAYGWGAADAVAAARQQVADVVGAHPQEIVFTSGATEAINLAVKGVAEAYAQRGRHVLALATEHKAVLDTCGWLAVRGWEVELLPVQADGLADLDVLRAALRPDTVLVCAMLANNETGVIQPVGEIAAATHAAGALLLCDAVQAVGKIPVDVQALGIDLMPVSAHKVYGPQGVGALYVRRRGPRVALAAQQLGGGHERGLRSGTLNVPGIVGMGAALALAAAGMGAEAERVLCLRNVLEASLLELPRLRRNGHPLLRLPHVSNLCFAGRDGVALMRAMPRVAVSLGAACTSAQQSPSHVLAAMGLRPEEASASLRFSLGRPTTPAEIEAVVAMLGKAVG